MFLEDLLSNAIAKELKDPFGTIRAACKALSKIRYVFWCKFSRLQSSRLRRYLNRSRELQRGVPLPDGPLSKETLIRSASSKALAATTEARVVMCKSLRNSLSLPSMFAWFCIGPDADRLRDGFQATSLDQDEVERILDACIKHSDHWSGFKVAAMGFRGKFNMQRWAAVTLQYQELHVLSSEMCVLGWWPYGSQAEFASTDSSCQKHASAHGVRSQKQSWKRCCSSCQTLNEALGLLRRAISSLGQFIMLSSCCLEYNKTSQTICDTWCTFDISVTVHPAAALPMNQ